VTTLTGSENKPDTLMEVKFTVVAGDRLLSSITLGSVKSSSYSTLMTTDVLGRAFPVRRLSFTAATKPGRASVRLEARRRSFADTRKVLTSGRVPKKLTPPLGRKRHKHMHGWASVAASRVQVTPERQDSQAWYG
jgi:hypothetical protein